MDNETLEVLKSFNTEHNTTYQLVPPYTHRRNAAERAMQTWKNHFVASLCTTDENFPLHLWDRLITQVNMTLTMLQKCRFNPKVSAYKALEGSFNCNTTPLAPIGCKIIAHETPEKHKTWAPHGVDGFYLGPAIEHYQCHQIYVPKMCSETIVEAVKFQPQLQLCLIQKM